MMSEAIDVKIGNKFRHFQDMEETVWTVVEIINRDEWVDRIRRGDCWSKPMTIISEMGEEVRDLILENLHQNDETVILAENDKGGRYDFSFYVFRIGYAVIIEEGESLKETALKMLERCKEYFSSLKVKKNLEKKL